MVLLATLFRQVWSLLLLTQLVISVDTFVVPQQAQDSPGPLSCGKDEYWALDHCCKNCAAGHRVRRPCQVPHTLGECVPCDRGTFTAYSSGLDTCLLCTSCSWYQEMVEDCTPTHDRLCQCQAGHYSDPNAPEACSPCSKCSGKAVLWNCNSTADTVCGPLDAGTGSWWLAILGLIAVLAIALILGTVKCYQCRPRKGDAEGRESEVSESTTSRPSLQEEADAAEVSILMVGPSSQDTDSSNSRPQVVTASPGLFCWKKTGGRTPSATPRNPRPRAHCPMADLFWKFWEGTLCFCQLRGSQGCSHSVPVDVSAWGLIPEPGPTSEVEP